MYFIGADPHLVDAVTATTQVTSCNKWRTHGLAVARRWNAGALETGIRYTERCNVLRVTTALHDAAAFVQ